MLGNPRALLQHGGHVSDWFRHAAPGTSRGHLGPQAPGLHPQSSAPARTRDVALVPGGTQTGLSHLRDAGPSLQPGAIAGQRRPVLPTAPRGPEPGPELPAEPPGAKLGETAFWKERAPAGPAGAPYQPRGARLSCRGSSPASPGLSGPSADRPAERAHPSPWSSRAQGCTRPTRPC